MRLLDWFLGLQCFILANCQNFSDLIKIDRILNKRDALENMIKDDPSARCRNGGIFAGGQCHCIHPHTGPNCLDFACVHGISVGRRYDPTSLFFSRPCICNDGWKGDLCEYHLTDRCNQRGEWVKDRCDCIGSFFGDECQYTSRCDFGSIKHGRCICHQSFQGDYCEKAVCYHGYADISNHSHSCVCPAIFKGVHCDQCAQVGKKILPYPKCVVDFGPQERYMRKKTKHQNKSRIFIIIGAITFLFIVAAGMGICHIVTQRRKNPQEEAIRREALQERTKMLNVAALKVDEPESVHNTLTITKKEKRISLPSIFKMKRNSQSDRALRNRDTMAKLYESETPVFQREESEM